MRPDGDIGPYNVHDSSIQNIYFSCMFIADLTRQSGFVAGIHAYIMLSIDMTKDLIPSPGMRFS